VPVELLFDQGIGDIFVIRTAGNNVNGTMVMGSVDYAIEHLSVKLPIMM
jgi:carbonic anhydrase